MEGDYLPHVQILSFLSDDDPGLDRLRIDDIDLGR